MFTLQKSIITTFGHISGIISAAGLVRLRFAGIRFIEEILDENDTC